jgi:hypothetical protein
VIEATISLIVKYDKDVERVQQELPRLLAVVGDGDGAHAAHEADHGQPHGDGHHHHHHGQSHHHDAPEDEAYRRHTEGYFGAVPRRPRS